jgi:hypothetical protein
VHIFFFFFFVAALLFMHRQIVFRSKKKCIFQVTVIKGRFDNVRTNIYVGNILFVSAYNKMELLFIEFSKQPLKRNVTLLCWKVTFFAYSFGWCNFSHWNSSA